MGSEFEWLNLLDIILVAAALYAVITWLRRARAGLAVVGGLLLGAVYLIARELGLGLTATLFQGFFTLFLVVLVVVLQHDLRRLFEGVALLGWRGKREKSQGPELVRVLTSAVLEMAAQRRGALIVLPGRDTFAHHAQGGERLEGLVSHSLLVSLFDPNSAGHDGAVIVENDRVTRFGAHLPLSENFTELGRRGTRHCAALGLSEHTDALCLVVSEERGEVAAAQHGRISLLDPLPEALRSQIQHHLAQVSRRPGNPLWRLAPSRREWLDIAISGGLAMALWVLFVSGSQASSKTVKAAVLVENVAPTLRVARVEPKEVEVTLSGLRRDLFALDPTSVEVRLDASNVTRRQFNFQVSKSGVKTPTGLSVNSIAPGTVSVQFETAGETAGDAVTP